jgi:hypothetical protein
VLRREPAVSDRGLGRLGRESAPTGVATQRTAVRAKPVVPFASEVAFTAGTGVQILGAEVVSEATASLVLNIAEKRVCGKRVLSKLRPSKIALAASNNFKVALQKLQLCFAQNWPTYLSVLLHPTKNRA